MKAAIINKYGSPEVFEIGEVPKPKVADDQVLIKIYAASINPVDFKTRKGNHKYILGSHFPIVLGYDFAGVVEETGKNVTRFKKGDKIHGRSDVKYGKTYAQYGISSESTISHIPESISFEDAAAVPLAGLTALQALRDKGCIKQGNKVLLIGATGGVGHIAVQLIKEFGAICFAVSSSRHAQFMNELKPDNFIDYTRENYKSLNEKFDIIFDAAGKTSYLKCKKMLKKKGVYITTLPRPKLIIHKFISLFSCGYVKTFLMKANHEDLNYIDDLIDQGKIKVKIDKTFSLEKISEAHQYAELGHTEGKIVISIDHG